MMSSNEMGETMEIWCDIADCPGYQISNFGRVRSLDRGMYVRQDRYAHERWTMRKGKVLKALLDGKGYPMVRPCIMGVSKTLMVHRLVAAAFIPNPENKPCVNNIDANPENNHYTNLEWCTVRENNQHTRKIGNYVKPWTHKKAVQAA